MSLVATINEPFDPDLDRVASDLLRAAGDAAQAAAALDDAATALLAVSGRAAAAAIRDGDAIDATLAQLRLLRDTAH